MSPINDFNQNPQYSGGFGQPPKPERIKIPDSPFWAQWREMLRGATDVIGGPGAKIAAAISTYSAWEETHEDFTGKQPTKGQRRIAQQICADYLKIPREKFCRLLKSFDNGSSIDMGGGENV